MDDAALLAEIRANPDDDSPRLVYADLLTERGDPRGEFITLQIQKPDDPRAKELWREHGAQWMAAAGIAAKQPGFVRGFPNGLVGTWSEIAGMLDAIATQPITALSISGAPVPGVELFARPELARIQQLQRIGALAEHDLETLAHSPHLGALVRLFIHRATLGAREIEILAPRIAALERFHLSENGLGVDGAHALARIAAPNLEYLGVGEEIGGEGIAAIVESPIVTTVDSLHFDGARGGVDGARALARSPRLGTLRVLGLANNNLGVDSAALLGDSRSLASLEELELRYNPLGHAGVDALARGTGLPKLRKLSVELEETELEKRFPNRPDLVVTR